jgi:hypothetical protein
MAIWYILLQFGIFYCNLVYFMAIWYILWQLSIFYYNLVYLIGIGHILWQFGIFDWNLVYFMANWIFYGNLVYSFQFWYVAQRKIWQPRLRDWKGLFSGLVRPKTAWLTWLRVRELRKKWICFWHWVDLANHFGPCKLVPRQKYLTNHFGPCKTVKQNDLNNHFGPCKLLGFISDKYMKTGSNFFYCNRIHEFYPLLIG